MDNAISINSKQLSEALDEQVELTQRLAHERLALRQREQLLLQDRLAMAQMVASAIDQGLILFTDQEMSDEAHELISRARRTQYLEGENFTPVPVVTRQRPRQIATDSQCMTGEPPAGMRFEQLEDTRRPGPLAISAAVVCVILVAALLGLVI